VNRSSSSIILKLNLTRILKALLIIYNIDVSKEEKFIADCLNNNNISFLENKKIIF
jgi:hypothetical protein